MTESNSHVYRIWRFCTALEVCLDSGSALNSQDLLVGVVCPCQSGPNSGFGHDPLSTLHTPLVRLDVFYSDKLHYVIYHAYESRTIISHTTNILTMYTHDVLSNIPALLRPLLSSPAVLCSGFSFLSLAIRSISSPYFCTSLSRYASSPVEA